MDRVLGLALLVVYIATIVGLAAAVTYAVIRIFPTDRKRKKPDKPDAPSDEQGGGNLFRRSKRATT